MTSPVLWYLNRGTGVVLLLVFTMTVLLGVLATGRAVHPWWPRFVTQGLHRALAAMSVLLLTAHVLTAVLDEYVDIRWWQALSPEGATYEPLWLGLGTLAFDVMLVVAVSTWTRTRLSHRAWHLVHLLGYAVWPKPLVEG